MRQNGQPCTEKKCGCAFTANLKLWVQTIQKPIRNLHESLLFDFIDHIYDVRPDLYQEPQNTTPRHDQLQHLRCSVAWLQQETRRLADRVGVQFADCQWVTVLADTLKCFSAQLFFGRFQQQAVYG